jgi:RNA polymerase sigma factor (TIGR02999 family)
MRQVLVDQARLRNAAKRGAGVVPVTLEEGLLGDQGALDAHRLLDLDAALAELEAVDPRAARVVECRFFGGMEVEETAQALGISTATVKRDWRIARARLAQALG